LRIGGAEEHPVEALVVWAGEQASARGRHRSQGIAEIELVLSHLERKCRNGIFQGRGNPFEHRPVRTVQTLERPARHQRERTPPGLRVGRFGQLTEVHPVGSDRRRELEDTVVSLQEIFSFDPRAKCTTRRRHGGMKRGAGNRPFRPERAGPDVVRGATSVHGEIDNELERPRPRERPPSTDDLHRPEHFDQCSASDPRRL
jgi:hypothetical protein